MSYIKAAKYAGRIVAYYDYLNNTRQHEKAADTSPSFVPVAESYVASRRDTVSRNLLNEIRSNSKTITLADFEREGFFLIDKFYEQGYDQQRRELDAVKIFSEVLLESGTDIEELGSRTDIRPTTISGWITFYKRMPWYLVTSIERLQRKQPGNWTPEGAINQWLRYSKLHAQARQSAQNEEVQL